jgi:hypothetical protein
VFEFTAPPAKGYRREGFFFCTYLRTLFNYKNMKIYLDSSDLNRSVIPIQEKDLKPHHFSKVLGVGTYKNADEVIYSSKTGVYILKSRKGPTGWFPVKEEQS